MSEFVQLQLKSGRNQQPLDRIGSTFLVPVQIDQVTRRRIGIETGEIIEIYYNGRIVLYGKVKPIPREYVNMDFIIVPRNIMDTLNMIEKNFVGVRKYADRAQDTEGAFNQIRRDIDLLQRALYFGKITESQFKILLDLLTEKGIELSPVVRADLQAKVEKVKKERGITVEERAPTVREHMPHAELETVVIEEPYVDPKRRFGRMKQVRLPLRIDSNIEKDNIAFVKNQAILTELAVKIKSQVRVISSKNGRVISLTIKANEKYPHEDTLYLSHRAASKLDAKEGVLLFIENAE